jgi:hypothetical protein
MLDAGTPLRGHMLCGDDPGSSYWVILESSVEALMMVTTLPALSERGIERNWSNQRNNSAAVRRAENMGFIRYGATQ